jgi:hypothetical protein
METYNASMTGYTVSKRIDNMDMQKNIGKRGFGEGYEFLKKGHP